MCLTSKRQVLLLRLESSQFLKDTHEMITQYLWLDSYSRVLPRWHPGSGWHTPCQDSISLWSKEKVKTRWRSNPSTNWRLPVDNYLCVTAVGAIQAFTPEDWTDYQMYHEQVLSVGLSRLVLTYWDVLCFAWCPVCSWSMTLPMLFFSDTLFVLRRFGFVWTN